MPIIEVDHVSKEFRLGSLHGLKQSLLNATARLSGKHVQERPLFKALDDVSFTIKAGEIVGIIGHNGAGKSTLLKLLAHISQPTKGKVRVQGSVSPLIEVGAGFVADFTGRENVYLNGAILGMSRKEIDKKFDDIVAFSELEEFIDTPVKRYSSGMQVRLGFAVATSVDSDILIVDEVLAVGDLAFQRKCFDRMEEIIKRQGRTVLLVSHNIRQVDRLCSRVMLLDHGKIIADGNTGEICSLFYEQSNKKVGDNAKLAKAHVDTTGEVELQSVDVLDNSGNRVTEIFSCGELRIRVRFQLKSSLNAAEIIVGTHSTDFVYLTASTTNVDGKGMTLPAGVHELEYILPSFPLAPGIYCIRFSVFDTAARPLFIGETLETFHVIGLTNESREAGSRMLHIPAQWRLDGQPYSNECPAT